jgi:hypothetical protein
MLETIFVILRMILSHYRNSWSPGFRLFPVLRAMNLRISCSAIGWDVQYFVAMNIAANFAWQQKSF